MTVKTRVINDITFYWRSCEGNIQPKHEKQNGKR